MPLAQRPDTFLTKLAAVRARHRSGLVPSVRRVCGELEAGLLVATVAASYAGAWLTEAGSLGVLWLLQRKARKKVRACNQTRTHAGSRASRAKETAVLSFPEVSDGQLHLKCLRGRLRHPRFRATKLLRRLVGLFLVLVGEAFERGPQSAQLLVAQHAIA